MTYLAPLLTYIQSNIASLHLVCLPTLSCVLRAPDIGRLLILISECFRGFLQCLHMDRYTDYYDSLYLLHFCTDSIVAVVSLQTRLIYWRVTTFFFYFRTEDNCPPHNQCQWQEMRWRHHGGAKTVNCLLTWILSSVMYSCHNLSSCGVTEPLNCRR
jgi:hypothetical protein